MLVALSSTSLDLQVSFHFDDSVLSYIQKMTLVRCLEESFAALIGIIFIYEAFNKILDINRHRPARLHTDQYLPPNCSCSIWNGTTISRANMTINVRHLHPLIEFKLKTCFSSSPATKIKLINLLVHHVVHSMTKLTSRMCSSSPYFSSYQPLLWPMV